MDEAVQSSLRSWWDSPEYKSGAAAIIKTPRPFSQAEVSSTFGFTVMGLDRHALELYFHYCLDCDRDVETCTCHDSAKGTN